MNKPRAANETYRLPPPLFDARCKACWFTAGHAAAGGGQLLVAGPAMGAVPVAGRAAQHGPLRGRVLSARHLARVPAKVAVGAWETLAMSALGTGLAAVAGLALALPASRLYEGHAARPAPPPA
jgi:phosphonate transport system permease protein